MTFLRDRKVWKISPGKSHFQWRRGTWQSEKVISIGWEEVGNLNDFETIDELRAKIKAEGFSKAGYVANQLWAFKKVEEGDIVVAYGSYTILDVGIVEGPYFLSIDRFVKPYYDLYGHRKPVVWLKLGPIFINNPEISHYMAHNNTIFQITDNDTLRFIREVLDRSYQFRIKEKVDRKLPKSHTPRISYEFNEDDVAMEIETFSKALSASEEEKEIDVAEEFSKLKLGAAPNSIRTLNQVRAQVIITGSASTDLQKKVFDGLEVYIPHGSDENIGSKIADIKAFYNFIVHIVDTMVPGLGKKVVLISVENPIRDAYRFHGRTVFNFSRYLKEKSRFFWFFVAARELAYLLHNRFDYKHSNLMRALLIGAYEKGF
jgi:hypothetical protein